MDSFPRKELFSEKPSGIVNHAESSSRWGEVSLGHTYYAENPTASDHYAVDDEEYDDAMLAAALLLDRDHNREFGVFVAGSVLPGNLEPYFYIDFKGQMYPSLVGAPMQLVHNVVYALMGNRVPPVKGVDAVELVSGSRMETSGLEERDFKRALIVLKKKRFSIPSDVYPFKRIEGSKYCSCKSKKNVQDTYKLRLKFALNYVTFTKANDGKVVAVRVAST